MNSYQSDYDSSTDNETVGDGDERTNAQWQRDVAVTTLLKVMTWALNGKILFSDEIIMNEVLTAMSMLGVTRGDVSLFMSQFDSGDSPQLSHVH